MLGLLAGRGNIFGTADSRALGGDAGAAVERVRSRQRPRPAARRAGAPRAEALAEYEKTMLLALEETETRAGRRIAQQQERLVKLTDEVRESARAAGIARARYREGVADFLSLLDAERTAAAGRGRRRGGGRRLHGGGRALSGGGWLEVVDLRAPHCFLMYSSGTRVPYGVVRAICVK